jgi:hypothetical protein
VDPAVRTEQDSREVAVTAAAETTATTTAVAGQPRRKGVEGQTVLQSLLRIRDLVPGAC